jgi:hypothetical protein
MFSDCASLSRIWSVSQEFLTIAFQIYVPGFAVGRFAISSIQTPTICTSICSVIFPLLSAAIEGAKGSTLKIVSKEVSKGWSGSADNGWKGFKRGPEKDIGTTPGDIVSCEVSPVKVNNSHDSRYTETMGNFSESAGLTASREESETDQ